MNEQEYGGFSRGITTAYGQVSAEQVRRRNIANQIVDLIMSLMDAKHDNLPTGELQNKLAELIAQL
jgi:hypothetical protein